MKLIYSIFLILLPFALSCQSADCENEPVVFSSYEEAINWIRSARFKVSETVQTTNSSWIREASYYSCDGLTGFFIYTTRSSKTYIHATVPAELWKGFVEATSHGSFYDRHIKGRFRFDVD
ncbi:MAG: KTSC domain-containing protein [Saprospiraceae bacterium]